MASLQLLPLEYDIFRTWQVYSSFNMSLDLGVCFPHITFHYMIIGGYRNDFKIAISGCQKNRLSITCSRQKSSLIGPKLSCCYYFHN